ncbi:hypothetical protein [Futiania mangrovi]|uniref:PEP-CTERM sorting domain-containing protein n=1 Tax=Futiania mangrovi TaxID=2959716 RepID=A0A9J6PIP8_9PROT|nr:hypothetical protein [Futiania mangrovii]MCP1335954.1 hypothetical protein [Futiania mangrovii]
MLKYAFLCAASMASAFCAGSVQAGVIYNWQEIDTDARYGPMTGQIEISDAAWLSGSGAVSISGSPALAVPIDISPVLQFTFRSESTYRGDCAGLFTGCIGGLAPGDEVFSHSASNGSGDFQFSGVFDPLLQGSILFSADFGTLIMASSGTPIWSISYFESDEFPGQICPSAAGAPCETRGLWVLDQSTVPGRVNEAVPLGLVIAGIGGVFLLHRRPSAAAG